MSLQLYSEVRIICLKRSLESYDGWRMNQRPPRLGDCGFIVEILQAHGLPDNFVVESSGPDGSIVWIGDFTIEEVETVANSQ